MASCGLGSPELAALLEGSWPVLKELCIHVNNLVDGDANILMSLGVGNQMTALQTLWIKHNQITEDGNLRYFQVTWEIVVGMFLKNVGQMSFRLLDSASLFNTSLSVEEAY